MTFTSPGGHLTAVIRAQIIGNGKIEKNYNFLAFLK